MLDPFARAGVPFINLVQPLLPDELWELIEPLLPKWTPSPKGGQPPVTDRKALTGILFVLNSNSFGGG